MNDDELDDDDYWLDFGGLSYDEVEDDIEEIDYDD